MDNQKIVSLWSFQSVVWVESINLTLRLEVDPDKQTKQLGIGDLMGVNIGALSLCLIHSFSY